MASITISAPTIMPEVKLEGKLDLTMWRDGFDDDDEDKDSSIDLSVSQTSPPAVVNSGNPIKDIHAQPQTPSSVVPNFLLPQQQPPTVHLRSTSAFSGEFTDEANSDISDVSSHNKRSLIQHPTHLSHSHIKHQQQPEQTSRSSNGKNDAPLKERLSLDKEQQQQNNNIETTAKGGAKKVEFSKESAGLKMGPDESSEQMPVSKEKAKRSDSSDKGTYPERFLSLFPV
jgi:hypothetical protein